MPGALIALHKPQRLQQQYARSHLAKAPKISPSGTVTNASAAISRRRRPGPMRTTRRYSVSPIRYDGQSSGEIPDTYFVCRFGLSDRVGNCNF